MSLPSSIDRGVSADVDPTDCLHPAGEGAAIGRTNLPLTEPRRVQFKVLGIPQPKGSARGFVAMKAGKARAIVTSDNKSLKGWADSVRYAAQDAGAFFDGAVSLQIEFFFSRPKSVTAKKRPFMVTRPDTSKLVRGAEDALNGILWKDDAQVIAIIATKRYVDGPAGAVVTVTEVLP